MADDVTRKDLQSLQGHCNKQIADLEKRLLARINESQQHTIDELNKATEAANKAIKVFNENIDTLFTNDKELQRGHDQQGERLQNVRGVVDQHAGVIKQLQAEVF